jgi:lysyl-tRNA synthetase class 2
MEVETPALSRAGTTDPQLDAITARVQSLGADPLYLSTSPEFPMKRLLAAGFGDIYQISRVFRDGELGRWHQPEFTLLEWYRVGWNEEELMREVETLLRSIVEPHRPLGPTIRMSYREAFQKFLGIDVFAKPHQVRERLRAATVDVPADLDESNVIDLAFGLAITPRLPPDAISFVYDFPEHQAALARLKSTKPPVAARFEAFLGGLELANGFDELTDEAEQRGRFEADRKRRRDEGRHTPPIDEPFLAALAHGLPGCAGVAIGIDRLVAVAKGLQSLYDTTSFTHTGEE